MSFFIMDMRFISFPIHRSYTALFPISYAQLSFFHGIHKKGGYFPRLSLFLGIIYFGFLDTLDILDILELVC